ncbi:MAG: site-specific integrase [Hyphomicrobiales bacterium]|nr:MAG: site-specific integrase [Hyphomicrobiales bacterium]
MGISKRPRPRPRRESRCPPCSGRTKNLQAIRTSRSTPPVRCLLQLSTGCSRNFSRSAGCLSGEDPTDPRSVFRRASTHWLRHTYAHHALREPGKDLTVVQQILGHRSITTTAIYVKADMEARKRANDAINLTL